MENEIKHPKFLYFTKDGNITLKEKLQAQRLYPDVQFRNAAYANVFEECDGVFGDVPELFSSVPRAEDVMKEYEEAINALCGLANNKTENVKTKNAKTKNVKALDVNSLDVEETHGRVESA